MRQRWVLMFAIVVIASTVFLALHFMRASVTGAQAETPSLDAKAIPAAVGVSELKSVPVYLTGLGTVQAFNTVTVKVRVDDQLDTINFTEGQTVKAGDVLAQIDRVHFRPRSIWRLQPRLRIRPSLKTPSSTSSVIRQQALSPTRSNKSTLSPRLSASSKPPSRPIRRISKPLRLSSTTPQSRLPFQGGPASGCSTRAISSTQPIPPVWW
jgi:hypothetical protein